MSQHKPRKIPKKRTTRVEQHHRTQIKQIVANVEAQGLLRASVKFSGEMDDYPNYDFQEAQFMITKANSMFEQLPSGIRQKFNNKPAEFMQFANNPDNAQEMVDLGLRKGLDFKDAQGNATGVTAHVTKDGYETQNVNEPTPETPPA